MNVEVSLPFMINNVEHICTAYAFIAVNPEPTCVIHEVQVSTLDGSPVTAFSITDQDFEKIEGYIWARFNNAAGAELVELVPSEDADGSDEGDCADCTDCNCESKTLH